MTVRARRPLRTLTRLLFALGLSALAIGAVYGAEPASVYVLPTTGGALTSTHEIVKTLLDAPLPVIVWVGPPGSQAASAGTFITMASHVAVMAPGTNIGAATPVSGQG